MRKILSQVLVLIFIITNVLFLDVYAQEGADSQRNQNNTWENMKTVSNSVYGSDIEVFKYAMFSSNRTAQLTINSNKSGIKGNVHTNSNFLFQGNSLDIAGVCEASGKMEIWGQNINIDNKLENSRFI